jgi:hypothetical protein
VGDDYLDDEADEGDRFSDAIRILLLVAAVAAPPARSPE